MRITRITFPSVEVAACLAFFRDVLDLPSVGDTVRAGWTHIDIAPAATFSGAAHLAFNIPAHRFDAACAWLRERALILQDPMGEERFHLGGVWQSRSIYFAGPHDAVFELIARDALGGDATLDGADAFSGAEILCVSEVGLPTDNVPALVHDLKHRLGLPAFGEGSAEFAPMGDHEGLLIVVDRTRHWFPDFTRRPGALGVCVTLEGASKKGAKPRGHYADANGWVLRLCLPEAARHAASALPCPRPKPSSLSLSSSSRSLRSN